jgi:hypothetical protein
VPTFVALYHTVEVRGATSYYMVDGTTRTHNAQCTYAHVRPYVATPSQQFGSRWRTRSGCNAMPVVGHGSRESRPGDTRMTSRTLTRTAQVAAVLSLYQLFCVSTERARVGTHLQPGIVSPLFQFALLPRLWSRCSRGTSPNISWIDTGSS